MTLAPYILLIILGCSIVTMLEKSLPIWLLGNRKLPPKLERWLSFAPAAVLTALLVPEVLLSKNPDQTYTLFLSTKNVFLLASVPALIIAYLKESFFGAVVVGMTAVALLRHFS